MSNLSVSLSWAVVDDLVDRCTSFFAHLNPLIWILDRQLHISLFCRQRSPLAFSAILLTSAKVIRPDLYHPSLDHINHLLGIGFQSGVSTVELIQSLRILVFWRESDDSSSYGKIGHVIRTAYELRLDTKHKPLPDDDDQARLILVQMTTTQAQMVLFARTYRTL